MEAVPIPTPSLVVLVGAPASGKSTWAAEHFRPEQIVCADTLRGIVGEHELDLSATGDAFELLDRIVGLRLGRGLTTVVDTTGVDPQRRAVYLGAARTAGATAVAVRFTTTAAECKRRNRERAHPVPAKALDQMIKKARDVDLDAEGWDRVIEPTPVRTVTKRLTDAIVVADSRHADEPSAPTSRLRFGLLVSDYSWASDTSELAAGLTRIAHEAERAGFDTFWVMDHLVQIPQVGRAWDPMLDAWSVLAPRRRRHAPDPARRTGQPDHVPAPGAAREVDRHARRAERRTSDRRHRGREFTARTRAARPALRLACRTAVAFARHGACVADPPRTGRQTVRG